jgi:hypothetical protein
MDFELDPFTTLPPRTTTPHHENSNLNIGWSPALLPLCNYREHATDSDDGWDNSINAGLNSVEQFIGSEISHVGDSRDEYLAVRQSEDALDLFSQAASSNAPFSCYTLNESQRLPPKRSENNRETRTKERQQGRKKRPLSAVETEERRKRHLERNRIAARKVRRKKSEELHSLQEKKDALERANMWLKLERTQMKQEADSLKVLITMHKDCNQLEPREELGDMEIFPGQLSGTRDGGQSCGVVVSKPNREYVSISVAELGMRSGSHEIGEESTLIPPLSTLELSSSSTTHIPEQDIEMGSPVVTANIM